MKCPEIVATIGIPFDEKTMNDSIDNSLKNGIMSFRFNLAKCTTILELENIEKQIRSLTLNGKMKDCKIMLDVPFPGKKVRISFKDDNLTNEFAAGEIVTIIGRDNNINDLKNKVIYLDINNICKLVSVGQKLIYSDGDCLLSVVEIDRENDCIIAKVSNTISMFTKKSLSFNYVVKELNYQQYIDLINRVIPTSVAFSFVTDLNSILECSNGIFDKEIEIISKIETANSLRNTEEIAKFSNLMLGRGDLLLNSDIFRMYEYQNVISKVAKQSKNKLYIATGILSSLVKQPIPTPAEVIDLYNIITCQPDAIILNAELIASENLRAAVKLIRDTASIVENY